MTGKLREGKENKKGSNRQIIMEKGRREGEDERLINKKREIN